MGGYPVAIDLCQEDSEPICSTPYSTGPEATLVHRLTPEQTVLLVPHAKSTSQDGRYELSMYTTEPAQVLTPQSNGN
eukprot:NODE_10741_length_326_cov_19.747292_g9828_i0.p1 GENE.NODE_10741_length_326_cov_19.747292_g9828_i0~~NODE_10741_length_326_cov_19.747292_g9828_i0.p1  ORF type:complete len:85 (+),score=24.22 NODE_10741_length_326_cov_19.747292_g9828_i0:27-257(+)